MFLVILTLADILQQIMENIGLDWVAVNSKWFCQTTTTVILQVYGIRMINFMAKSKMFLVPKRFWPEVKLMLRY